MLKTFRLGEEIKLTSQQAGRDPLWDTVKGLAIVLVILGHSLQDYIVDYDHNFFFRLIYSFHMPLFMFVSGYLARANFKPEPARLASRARLLVLPFFSWAGVHFCLDAFGRIKEHQAPNWHFWMDLVASPDWGLWFLWILFLCFCILYYVRSLGRLEVSVTILVLLVLQYINMDLHGFLGIGLLLWQLPYFFCGYFASRILSPADFGRLAIGLPAMAIFAALFPYWNRLDPLSVLALHSFPHSQALSWIYMCVVALAGTITVLFLISRLQPRVTHFG